MSKLLRALLSAFLAAQIGLAQPAFAAGASVNGEVKKIDESAGKITIKHGPIKNLDMDSMTMVFHVKEPAMLKKVKPGDKIKFEADRVNGALTVTELEKAK
jgi:Cu/Ag efflux protein CusF